jgi:hypothetical protein
MSTTEVDLHIIYDLIYDIFMSSVFYRLLWVLIENQLWNDHYSSHSIARQKYASHDSH